MLLLLLLLQLLLLHLMSLALNVQLNTLLRELPKLTVLKQYLDDLVGIDMWRSSLTFQYFSNTYCTKTRTALLVFLPRLCRYINIIYDISEQPPVVLVQACFPAFQYQNSSNLGSLFNFHHQLNIKHLAILANEGFMARPERNMWSFWWSVAASVNINMLHHPYIIII